MTAISRVILARLVGHYLFWIVLNVVALELHELVETESAQRLSLSRVLPSDPGQILSLVSKFYIIVRVIGLLVQGNRS
jgi:hypothetical protein